MRDRARIGLAVLFLGITVIIIWLAMASQFQATEEGFGIHLVENDEMIISDRDIVWYNKTSHEIRLLEEGADRIASLEVPVHGKPFVVKLHDEPIYNGSFWSPISSIPYHGVAIEQPITREDRIIKIKLGYPSSEFFEGTDPRDSPEILSFLQKTGKLVQ